MDQQPIFRAAERLIRLVFPRRVKTTNTWLRPLAKLFSPSVTLADIGCLEGGFSVEFARMGLDVTGLEVRESNMSACNYVKSRVNLPNLKFVKDDAWIHESGFNIVLEQYDHMGPDIASNMTEGFYHMQSRNSFVGIKL